MTKSDGQQISAERPVDVRVRDLEIRLAENAGEIAASQRLRYRVFCEEMSASTTDEMKAARREWDHYDDFCDHLLIFDTSRTPEFPEDGPGQVVATYRFMRREQAEKAGGFYTRGEYDISALTAYDGEIMELGRSCVDVDYRTGGVMQALWKGIAAYVTHFDVVLMFGCASLHGCDVEAHRLPLAYLHHNHMAPPELRPRTLEQYYVNLDLMPADEIDARTALKELPPLVKGYLRLGGYIGDGAFVDHEFGTTDVAIVVKTDLVTEKYRRNLTRSDTEEAGDDSKPGAGVA